MIERPEKETALGVESRAPKTDELPEGAPTTLFCQWCETNCCTIIEPVREGSLHFARLRCASCGRAIRFLEKPQTTECRRFNAYRIAKLLSMIDLLDGWKRKFITSIATQKKLSPRQQAKLDELAAACGIGGAR